MLALALLACKSPPTEPMPETDPPTPTDTDTGPELPVVDCTSVAVPPFDVGILEAPRAYHGIAFDSLGHLVGSDGFDIVSATSPSDAAVWIPNAGYTQQLEFLPTGELVTSTSGEIRKYTPDQEMQVLATQIDAHGVTIGPDGNIYTANGEEIHRIDPVTGDVEVYLMNTPANVLDFSVDHQTLFYGTRGDHGNIYAVALDEGLEPIANPVLFSSTPGTLHHTLRVDACGRLYVSEYDTAVLYVIGLDGAPQALLEYSREFYPHGLSWGSGVGEWDDHTLYIALPSNQNRVGTFDVGVPYRSWNGGAFEVIR
ncbi:MAG: hypothetical protein H6737_02880 [Alphaproteobacteria bacterium]|nr:hypothetical protein [Alphaproteobacteria bacterium]